MRSFVGSFVPSLVRQQCHCCQQQCSRRCVCEHVCVNLLIELYLCRRETHCRSKQGTDSLRQNWTRSITYGSFCSRKSALVSSPSATLPHGEAYRLSPTIFLVVAQRMHSERTIVCVGKSSKQPQQRRKKHEVSSECATSMIVTLVCQGSKTTLLGVQLMLVVVLLGGGGAAATADAVTVVASVSVFYGTMLGVYCVTTDHGLIGRRTKTHNFLPFETLRGTILPVRYPSSDREPSPWP